MATQAGNPDGGRYNTPDYSGLQFDETAQPAPGLEVDNRAHEAYPEAVNEAYPEAVHKTGLLHEKSPNVGVHPVTPLYYQASPDSHGPEVLPESGLAPPSTEQKGRSKRFWVLTGLGVAVLVAVVVGCVVGLVVVPNSRKAESSTNPESGSSSTPDSSRNNTSGSSGSTSSSGGGGSSGSGVARPSVCRDTICPQLLSVVQVDKRVMVFGRGIDKDIWYNTASIDAMPSWPEGQQWESLRGGPFLSQPSAISWAVNDTARVSVSAVSDADGNALMRQFIAPSSRWDATWQNQLGKFSSPISLCIVEDRRLDAWAIEGGIVRHNYYVKSKDNFFSPAESKGWQDPLGIGETGLVAQPGIACRYHPNFHDVFVYSSTGALKHTAFSNKGGWLSVATYSGGPRDGFRGNPTVLATGDRRADFFGIGKDGAMYHGYFSEDDGHPSLTNLGGSFQSVPAAVRTASGRVDVVALGTKDTLMHRVLVGDEWSPEWEDLGVFGDSAPVVANFTTTPETVGLFVMGTNGEVNQTVWTVGEGLSWKGLQWKSMGGNLTTDYMGI